MGEKIALRKSSKQKKNTTERPPQSCENGSFTPNGIALRALTVNVPKHKLIRDAESVDNGATAFDPAALLLDKKRHS